MSVSLSGFLAPFSRLARPQCRDSIHPAFLPVSCWISTTTEGEMSDSTHRLTTCPVGGNRLNLLGLVVRVNSSTGGSFELFELDPRGCQDDVPGEVDQALFACGEVGDPVALDAQEPVVSGV